MREHPFLVAGTGRLDTDLMETTNLVTKIGAEAVLGAGNPDGWGMAIKISDGADRALPTAARAALARLDSAVKAESIVMRGLHGETVGEIQPLL
jgi:L-asparaginase II